jgi:hypothetical protein
MSTPIPTTEPTSFYAGDLVQWTKALSDYPASTWTLTYYLRGATGASITATAASNGVDFSVSIAAATTLTYSPGAYDLFGVVTSGLSTYTIYKGGVTITPAASSLNTTYDARSFNKRVLDALEASVAGQFTAEFQTISIGGKHLSRYSMAERLELHARFKALVESENIAAGLIKGGRNVFTRFSTPS